MGILTLAREFCGKHSYTANSLLNAGLAAFKEDVYKDEIASLRVEVALVTFGPVRLAQDFVTIDNFTPPRLKADDVTPMREVIEYALDLLEERKET